MLRSLVSALRYLVIILTFSCLNGAGVLAQRGNPTVACLDTMVVKAKTVFVGRVVEAAPYRQGHGANVVFEVEKRLRGSVTDRTEVAVRASDAALARWKTEGHRLLIAVPADGLVPADAADEGYQSAIDLSAPNLTVVRADMTILQNADSVVAAAEEAIRTHPGGDGIKTFMRTIPIQSAWTLRPTDDCELDEKWSLNCLVTLVPVDENLERWALNAVQSPYVWERADGAAALRNFPSDDHIALLKTLLEDEGLNAFPDGPIYLVRQQAYRALSLIGVRVPEPVVRPIASGGSTSTPPAQPRRFGR